MARQRDEHKTEAIFEAALKLVLQMGYGGLRMADIAKESQLATGTLYVYFKNKEELINQLYLHLKKKKVQAMMRGFKAEEPFYNNFKRMWLNMFNACYENPEEMIFFEQFYRSSYISKSVAEEGDAMALPAAQFIEHASKQQLIIDASPYIIYGQVVGPITELVKYHLDTQTKVSEKDVEAYFEMAWRAIRK